MGLFDKLFKPKTKSDKTTQISDFESLVRDLRDEDEDVRERAAKKLGDLGDQRAVATLIPLLRDKEWIVRSAAAISLGKIGSPEAVNPLIASLKDTDGDVRKLAAEALKRIGGQEVEHALQVYHKDLDKGLVEGKEAKLIKDKDAKLKDSISQGHQVVRKKSVQYLILEGTQFSVVNTEQLFFDECHNSGQAAMIFPFTEYSSVIERGYQANAFDHRTRLLCARCFVDIPMSFEMSLMERSSKAAKCPYCRSDLCILLWDCPEYGEITEQDMQALREMWRSRCQLWWRQNNLSDVPCKFCSATIPRGEGFDIGHIICSECATRITNAKALSEVRKNPDHFGTSELRRARNFIAGRYLFERGQLSKTDESKIKKMINRVEICFNASSSPYSEPDVIEDLIKYFGLAVRFTSDVHITTSYGNVPDVAEALDTGDISGTLQDFCMFRARLIGMIQPSEEDVLKLRIYPFKIRDTLGVLIVKEADTE